VYSNFGLCFRPSEKDGLIVILSLLRLLWSLLSLSLCCFSLYQNRQMRTTPTPSTEDHQTVDDISFGISRDILGNSDLFVAVAKTRLVVVRRKYVAVVAAVVAVVVGVVKVVSVTVIVIVIVGFYGFLVDFVVVEVMHVLWRGEWKGAMAWIDVELAVA